MLVMRFNYFRTVVLNYLWIPFKMKLQTCHPRALLISAEISLAYG